jgi:hypothetical protein
MGHVTPATSYRRVTWYPQGSRAVAGNCIRTGPPGTGPLPVPAWTVLATPGAATFSALGSVSCSSPVHCASVGASGATATGTVSPLTEVWNGSAWTVVTAPK